MRFRLRIGAKGREPNVVRGKPHEDVREGQDIAGDSVGRQRAAVACLSACAGRPASALGLGNAESARRRLRTEKALGFCLVAESSRLYIRPVNRPVFLSFSPRKLYEPHR